MRKFIIPVIFALLLLITGIHNLVLSGKCAKLQQELIRQERDIARRLYDIVRRDSRIGFEASNHYYYTLNDLREKVLSCELMLEDKE